MPSHRSPWPHDDRPDYIIRDERRLANAEINARSYGPFASVALQLITEHYAALASMKELKRVLDDYCDGVKP